MEKRKAAGITNKNDFLGRIAELIKEQEVRNKISLLY